MACEPKSSIERRRNYFIERSFQTRFILKFCGLVVAAGVLTILFLYLFSGRSTTVNIVNSRVVVKSTADYLLPLLLQTVFIVAIIVGIAAIFITLLVSHKIAGPLYRLKKAMQEVSNGDFVQIHLRELDQLGGLAEGFNDMSRKLKEKFQK